MKIKEPRQKGFFITGTDTGVGKTYIASRLASSLRTAGIDAGVMKPVETGCAVRGKKLRPSDGLALMKAAGVRDSLELVVPFRFRFPLSPLSASLLEGRKIDIQRLLTCYKKLSKLHELMIVEGAGGLLVPITKKYSYLNFIKDTGLDVILVASNRLGMINHTILTLSCLATNNITTAFIVINNPTPTADMSQRTNPDILKTLIPGVRIITYPYSKTGRNISAEHDLLIAALQPSGKGMHTRNTFRIRTESIL